MKKLLLVSLFFLSACASTEIKSSKNSNFAPYTPQKVVVMAANVDPDDRPEVESFFVKDLDRTELEGISFLELFPPEGKFSEEQIQKMLDDNGIDGSLVVIEKDMLRSDRFVSPGFYDMSIRSGLTAIDMPSAPDAREGYDMPKRVFRFRVSLLDRKQRLIWTADCVTEGTTNRSIYGSLAKTAVKKMIADGIIEKNTGK